MSRDDILECVELLDLDEDVIDQRLKAIMSRETFTEKQLSNAVLLLKYKLLINNQENDDCDNDEELKFATKLLLHMEEANVSLVSKILSLVLNLNKDSLVSNSEHLLQQILSNLFCDAETSDCETPRELCALKICDNILDVLVTNSLKASLPFLEAPVDKIIYGRDENLRKHFLVNTVPRLIASTLGYSVLDKIFKLIMEYKDEKIHEGLKVLSCLADFYLPQNGKALLPEGEFWRMVLYGMNSSDFSQRKTAMYLAKRGAEVSRKTNSSSFFINNDRCKSNWDNFFVLIESLEEKQSNIVLPSLQIFETLQPHVAKLWLNFAFKIGLKHENTQVKKQCIEHRLKHSIDNTEEAKTLLESMNDVNLYCNQKEAEAVITKLKDALKDDETFLKFWQAVPKIQWSPIPLYYISSLLDPTFEVEFIIENEDTIIQAVIEIIKLQCNNIAIKQHTQHQMMQAINKISKNINWRSYMKVLAMVNVKIRKDDGCKKIVNLLPDLTQLKINKDEMKEFHDFITNTPLYIRETLNYFKKTEQMEKFLNIINGKVSIIKDTNSRQYCNIMQGFDDYVYLMHLSMYFLDPESTEGELSKTIVKELNTFLQYFVTLLSDDATITISSTEDIDILVNILTFSELFNHSVLKHVYKIAMTILTDETYKDLVRKVACVKIIDLLLTDPRSKELYEPDIKIISKLKLTNENAKREIQGKLKDYFYETAGSIVFTLLQNEQITDSNLDNIVNFIDNCMEFGGSESVFWAVRIVALNLKKLKNKIDLKTLIKRIWQEMQEMNTDTYVQCMSEFTNIILHDVVITNAEFNNTIVVYFNKILELGKSQASYDPLYCFVCSLKDKKINMENGQLVHFLEEILMFAPVIKREQRILDGITAKLDEDLLLQGNYHQRYTVLSIQEEVLSVLLHITDDKVHQEVIKFIMNKIDETFRNRDRYHADSQHHKTILIGLQHLLFYSLIRNQLMDKTNVDWCVKLLNKMPHQPSVRICLEWYIALYICSKKLAIIEETVNELNLATVPQTSQLSILYHAMKHRINCDLYEMKEYEFVVKFLLSNTMGPNFNVRLLAQFLALKLHKLARPDPDDHKNIINIVEKTLKDSSHEKAYIKLEKDFFADQFDVICHLTPYFIYRFVPKYFGLNVSSGLCILPSISECREYMQSNNDEIKAWSNYCWSNNEVDGIKIEDVAEVIDIVKEEAMGAIQKKYIPWKNMDVGYGDNLVKKETSSELIIVASLIDKLPNLGGLARTSEVFGVKTCVVPSLAKLRDPQFQGLSVSAERWVDIQEVRPGQPLKQYLMMKKDEGYTVVAAEQTSDSVLLQKFKFPKKTVLILGHEKNGIPCDLLPLMDACVEIPQSGYVRSLNVHVTAAIFVWEYSRQNML